MDVLACSVPLISASDEIKYDDVFNFRPYLFLNCARLNFAVIADTMDGCHEVFILWSV